MSQVEKIVDAMIELGMSGTKVFCRIMEDIDRGDMKRAKEELGFVDILIKARKEVPK